MKKWHNARKEPFHRARVVGWAHAELQKMGIQPTFKSRTMRVGEYVNWREKKNQAEGFFPFFSKQKGEWIL